ncbi:hypothetical protein [Psychromonas sp. Urea-02u-13]|uniref:hypothetical protein n=1 Tax=Psychromonas sp. Urea-02u-13 TaxID=2058326 RepID=UPI000C339F4B|nr:hypothetical protein [Psychromonas sp. Urea-02u-13]PKG38319.1 hypothetical protein CXF74_14480 [Psychromonas sp. Urea-02u-13]
MNTPLKILKNCFLFTSITLLAGCAIVHQEEEVPLKSQQKYNPNFQVKLNQYQQSNFKQVEATFFTQQPKELVFRVLSNIEQTSQWLQRLDSLEVLTVYNNHQYLLRTVINSPWPFKNRELITCVDTFFEEDNTTINIYSCSERVESDEVNLRLSQLESSWKITKISDSLVEVNYKAWLDPAGIVPAFIFNSELIDGTKADFIKLQAIINDASLDQYSY